MQGVPASMHDHCRRQSKVCECTTQPAARLSTKCEPLGGQDWGLKDAALGSESRGTRAPDWLQKWAALVLEYIEEEKALLPAELLAIPPPFARYTPASAAAEAKGAH